MAIKASVAALLLAGACAAQARVTGLAALVQARLLLAEDADAYARWAQSDAVAKRFR